MIKLLCGLGNPGREYAATRHNAGWMMLDRLPFAVEYQSKFNALFGTAFPAPGRKLLVLKPQLFMNKSGMSLRACVDFFNLDASEILVVHDDLELEYGQVVLKEGGGLGGHNGLKSIVQHLGTDGFKRLRFGIGRPQHGSVSSFVLSRFSPDQEIDLERNLDKALELITGAL